MLDVEIIMPGVEIVEIINGQPIFKEEVING